MNLPTLVIGSRGLLGSAIVNELRKLGLAPTTPKLDWSDGGGLLDTFTQSLVEIAQQARDQQQPWTAFWCAGLGTVSAPIEVHRSDVAHLRAFTTAAKRACEIAPGRIALASSAGALYAGSDSWPVTEETPTAPTHDYGRSKLLQETMLAELVADTDDRLAAVSLRISNLYGPGQAVNKPQGLLSHLVLNTLRRQPLSIYVPLDTSRDYLFVSDASRMAVEATFAIDRSGYGVRILASERNHTVAQVLAVISRLMKRKVPHRSLVTPTSSKQPSMLSFRSLHSNETSRAHVSLEEGLMRTIDSVKSGIVR